MPGSYSHEAAEPLGRWRFVPLNLFFLLIAIGLYTKNIGDVTAWPYYNWLWDYEFGFMRRALPGSILAQFVSPPISYVTVGRVSLAIGLVLTILLSVLSAAVIHRHFRSVLAWTLVLGFLFAGFGIKAIAHAIGTFEQINFIITIVVLLILQTGHLTFTRVGLAGLVAAPMLLIHEGAIFFCFPILLAYLIVRLRQHSGTEAVARFVLFMAAPGVALLALLWHPMPDVSPDIFIQAMRARGSYDELTMVHDMLALFNPGVPLLGRTFWFTWGSDLRGLVSAIPAFSRGACGLQQIRPD